MIGDFIKGLTRVRRGEDIREVAKAERINALVDAVLYLLRGENIKFGPGFLVGSSLGKMKVNIRKSRGRGGGGGYSVWNFSTTSEEGKFTIKFLDGLINNILCSNINEKIPLNSGNNYIFAEAVASESTIESVKLVVSNSPSKAKLVEAEESPPSKVPVLIAMAVIKDESLRVTRMRYRNVVCTPIETRKKSKKPEGGGQEPFTRLYAWKVEDTS